MPETPSTKERLLKAAGEIFAEKGFRDATVAEICEMADANIAAVNYHFGDKESLYDAVWRHAFDVTRTTYPLDEGLPEKPSMEDYLFSYANSILHRIFCEDEAGLFPKLLHREMAAPTLALDRIAEETLFPQNKFMGTAIEDALGKQLSEQQLRLCMQSVIGQCVFYNFSRPMRERLLGKTSLTKEEIERIARHIATFSIGGLKEIQKD